MWALLVACSDPGPGRNSGDLPWAVDSRLNIGGENLATGVVYPEWTTVFPAAGMVCDESRWVRVRYHGYTVGASLELALDVGLAVRGAGAQVVPDLPFPHPVHSPVFTLGNPTDDTDESWGLFGGSATVDETEPDLTVLGFSGADRCVWTVDDEWAGCEPAGDVVLELDGPLHDVRNQGCYEGEPLDPWGGDGPSPCVPAGSGEPTGSNRIDCP